MRKTTYIRDILLLILFMFLASCSLFSGCKASQDDMRNRNVEMTRGERTVKNGVFIENTNIGGMRETEVRRKIIDYARKVNVEPKDALLDEATWDVTRNEQPGVKVDVDKTMERVMNASPGDKVKVVMQDALPRTTAEGLKANIVEIGSYSTPLLDRQDSRVNNIAIASEKIDLKKLAPGEEFSFNKTVGRRTAAKGYEEAPIIVKTEEGYKKGYATGGGICQIATTLYNASLKGGMEITERHEHSKDVGYVAPGKDATVSFGSVDLKFKNSRQYPVMIRTYLGNKTLTVKLYENRN